MPMSTAETNVETAHPASPVVPAWQRWLVYSPLARIVIFVLIMMVLVWATGYVGRVAGIPLNQRVPFDQVTPMLEALRLLPAVLAYWLLVRLIEKRPVDELSLRRFVPYTVAGLVAGAILFSLVVGVLWLAGSYHVLGTHPDIHWLGPVLVLGVGAGVGEEIISRGVLFRIVEEGLGTWFALALSALFFGAAHLGNPNATTWSALAIAIEAGLLFGLVFHVTRSLWLCMGIHAAWNVMQGPVYGIPVSGFNQQGWLNSTLSGPVWLTGGSFGAEASVIALLICSLLSVGFLLVALRRGSIVPPFWRRPGR
jgi:membrane protease YdiL (CAAX protease family)